jgi:linoleoyl-CoA desaturase
MSTEKSKQNLQTFNDLKKQVFFLLSSQKVSVKRPQSMLVKSTFLWAVWLVSYSLFLIYGPSSPLLAVTLTLIWTVAILIIQLAVMHDASHGASSDSKAWNKFLTSSISFLGGSAVLWKYQHCIAHHNNTNTYLLDHDVDTGDLLRLHPSQPVRPIHRFQHIYAWLLYPLFILSWVWWGDLRDIIYNTYSIEKSKMKTVILEFVLVKLWHIFLFLLVPIVMFQSLWLPMFCYFLGFSIMGFFMVVIFQLAHVTGVQVMPHSQEELGGDWIRQQVSTTANFAIKNRVLSLCVGGLNFQIEHHLFPAMSHLNYPLIQPLVENFCSQNKIPYFKYPTVFAAIRAHQRHLISLGTN